jgi:hypothetical protein
VTRRRKPSPQAAIAGESGRRNHDEQVDGEEDPGGHRRPRSGDQIPDNATVITTGPGVIIATATASRNYQSSSHPWVETTSP